MDCCRDQNSFFVSENTPKSVDQVRNFHVQSRKENYTGRREWNPQWIGTENRNDEENNLPPELFQKKFMASARPIRAILQVSAMGIYSIALNGRRIEDSYFNPGYTHYESYVQYQTYDVTAAVQTGENILRIIVANGWWLGRLGNRNNVYGDRRGIAAVLKLLYEDGSSCCVEADESWTVTTDSPVRYADYYNGETIDLRRMEEEKWNWKPVCRIEGKVPEVKRHFGAFVKEEERLRPVSVNGAVYDFGQNHAGILRLCVKAGRDTVITIRHGEILTDDGMLFTDNLRSAKQTMTFICGKNGINTFTPLFTFMGFRYAEVKSSEPVEIVAIESAVLTSDTKPIGSFQCSDPLLNRLQQNIQWGQKSNFIDIPTDCPQRDERMGWTGDIAVFARTAAFNRDISAFMRKWLYDLRMYQRENGAIPVTIPENQTYQPTSDIIPIAIWGDAATMVPWAVYRAYGDKDFLSEQYESMKAYTDAEIAAAASTGEGSRRYLWDENPFQYGDWCAAGETYEEWIAKGSYLATAYLSNSVEIMRKAAEVLDCQMDVQYYAEVQENIRNAFAEHCILPDGTLNGDFQSNYVCALHFRLAPETKRTSVAARLASLVRECNYTVRTGFAGTPYLLFALADNGYVQEAYRVLQNEACPGWLYTVKAGATTMWERWDALDERGRFYKGNGADMVSFNHYAYGAVGDFFYSRILGIEPVEAGYQRFRIRPVPGGTLTWAEGSLETRFGKVYVRWEVSDETFCLYLETPIGLHGEIVMPDGKIYRTDGGSRMYRCLKFHSSSCGCDSGLFAKEKWDEAIL